MTTENKTSNNNNNNDFELRRNNWKEFILLYQIIPRKWAAWRRKKENKNCLKWCELELRGRKNGIKWRQRWAKNLIFFFLVSMFHSFSTSLHIFPFFYFNFPSVLFFNHVFFLCFIVFFLNLPEDPCNTCNGCRVLNWIPRFVCRLSFTKNKMNRKTGNFFRSSHHRRESIEYVMLANHAYWKMSKRLTTQQFHNENVKWIVDISHSSSSSSSCSS